MYSTVLKHCSSLTSFNRTGNNELQPYFRYEMNFDSEFEYSGYDSNLKRNNPGKYRASAVEGYGGLWYVGVEFSKKELHT